MLKFRMHCQKHLKKYFIIFTRIESIVSGLISSEIVWNDNVSLTVNIIVSDRTDNKEIVRLMMDIFQLAVQYLITRLENVSIHYLELKISKSNVLDALYYADKMK